MVNPNFEESATKVKEKVRKKGKNKGNNNTPKGKGYTDNYPPYQKGKGKGKGKGKYGSRPYNVKGRGRGYNNLSITTTTTIDRKATTTTTTKEEAKGKGSKNKSTLDNIPPLPPYKGKGSTKGKGKRTNIVCYYCGKPGHTSDKYWWKGPIYSIDQSTPMWSLPNDVQSQNLQQLPPSSSASTTIMTQPQQTRLDHMQLYKTGSFQTTINSISATLTIDKNSTSKDQLRQWAILIDTGAMTSVASQDRFTHIPLKPLRPQDPHTLTAVNGEQLNIYRIKEVTLVYQSLAILPKICHLRRQLRNTWSRHYHKEHSTASSRMIVRTSSTGSR
eukprot:982929-Amphidinium_carterae.2